MKALQIPLNAGYTLIATIGTDEQNQSGIVICLIDKDNIVTQDITGIHSHDNGTCIRHLLYEDPFDENWTKQSIIDIRTPAMMAAKRHYTHHLKPNDQTSLNIDLGNGNTLYAALELNALQQPCIAVYIHNEQSHATQDIANIHNSATINMGISHHLYEDCNKPIPTRNSEIEIYQNDGDW